MPAWIAAPDTRLSRQGIAALSRSARLLDLLQALRRRRHPVRGADLAEELGVSLRTLYRDIATLQAQGAAIEGEAGLGYVLRPGFFLPPLRFSEDEMDALLLGLRFVAQRGAPVLDEAAEDALAKILAAMPPEAELQARDGALLSGMDDSAGAPHLATLREAMQQERRLHLRYTDKKGVASERIVWPVAIGFFGEAEVLAAWCETRQDFRHFRLDRIVALRIDTDRYPRRRRLLLAEWRLQQDLEDLF
ncbi:YafY family protein [Roseomonas gilardii]|uniref:YafY family protein n=1 Tax=Roseomonas gilardii TaxID=257708 RepID=A0ABU3MBH1_9PROT|nr:YafY family protein [Roseomonas gilardii]MDT8330238.1 YafY family protein [Roseomonas gilardii]